MKSPDPPVADGCRSPRPRKDVFEDATKDMVGPRDTPIGDVTSSGGPREEDIQRKAIPAERIRN
jgi:hypothetical protein